jgi:hypothetical protein
MGKIKRPSSPKGAKNTKDFMLMFWFFFAGFAALCENIEVICFGT